MSFYTDMLRKRLNYYLRTFSGSTEGVVYSIPASCGKVYIGQTGQCLNGRLKEHACDARSGTGSNLALDVKGCHGCVPLFHQTSILGRGRTTIARELLDAFFIKTNGQTCISQPSVALIEKEWPFLSVPDHQVV